MRRKVELWIDFRRADLADDGFILYNYTMEDLASPAVVRNSFSRQITLPGTSSNNRIFGQFFRNDRVTEYSATLQLGRHFDPTRKTTWRLYNERSELLESGYLRLDSVTRKRNVIAEYKVTLFGGLGQFLYGLAYTAAGEKRTLADLDYRGLATPANEFNFTLNASAVRQAWTRIASAAGAPSQAWDFINFAPCYNGKPSGTFDAAKGLLDVVEAGIGVPSGTRGGVALVTLPREFTEWETKDLRSYLQRPVVRMRGILDACFASRNNGGWTVQLDPTFFDATNPYYQKTWLTLPIINTETLLTQTGGTGSLTWSQVGGDPSVIQATLTGGGDNNKNYTVALHITPKVTLPSSLTGTVILDCEEGGTYWMSYVEYNIIALDANDAEITRKVVRISSRQAASGVDAPVMDATGNFTTDGTTGTFTGGTLETSIAAPGIKKIRISAETHPLKWGTESADTPGGNAVWTDDHAYSTMFYVTRYTADMAGSGFSYGGLGGGRSGKSVTKAEILSGGGTPADYLLAFCKTFGLVMVADSATKTVSIMPRSEWYTGEVLDIEDRIDTGSGFEKAPFAFDARWYVWAQKYESGEWAKAYLEKYGRTFGQQRVDTGYAFDANTNAVMDGVIFRGAVMALENSECFCTIVQDGDNVPAVFVNRGATYNMYLSEEEQQDVEITRPGASAVKTWLNPDNMSYDLFPKPQFHDKENAPFDERDTLLFFDGMTASGDPYTLTDDTDTMMDLNGGTPCWLLQWADHVAATAAPALPKFSRYLTYSEAHTGYVYEKSLDFGTPAEVPIPGVTFQDGATVFSQFWADYISDRYDDDSAVLRCKVNLHGLKVGPELLRSFYWFDGAVWALNRIINHSVTTYDLTECEFVKVQDAENYTG